MSKAIVFDMDGTIVNLYGVSGWLQDLRNENARPYQQAEPMYQMEELNTLLLELKNQGWKVIVTTWLSMTGSLQFHNRTRYAKKKWLEKHGFPADSIHMVAYGTPKHGVSRKESDYQILVDDNEEVRKDWDLGKTIDATENIIIQLRGLLA